MARSVKTSFPKIAEPVRETSKEYQSSLDGDSPVGRCHVLIYCTVQYDQGPRFGGFASKVWYNTSESCRDMPRQSQTTPWDINTCNACGLVLYRATSMARPLSKDDRVRVGMDLSPCTPQPCPRIPVHTFAWKP